MKPIPCCASDIFSQIPVESVSPDFLRQGAELSLLSGFIILMLVKWFKVKLPSTDLWQMWKQRLHLCSKFIKGTFPVKLQCLVIISTGKQDINTSHWATGQAANVPLPKLKEKWPSVQINWFQLETCSASDL